jgi:hypothetical protein
VILSRSILATGSNLTQLIGFELLNDLSGDEAKNVTVVPTESAVVS